MGNLLLALNHVQWAIKSFNDALDFKHNNVWALIGLTKCYKTQNMNEKAHSYLKRAVEFEPNGHLFLGVKRFFKSSRVIYESYKVRSRNGWLYFVLGKVLINQNNFQLAQVYLKQSAILLPSNPDVYLSSGHVLTNMELHQEAEKYFSKFNASE